MWKKLNQSEKIVFKGKNLLIRYSYELEYNEVDDEYWVTQKLIFQFNNTKIKKVIDLNAYNYEWKSIKYAIKKILKEFGLNKYQINALMGVIGDFLYRYAPGLFFKLKS